MARPLKDGVDYFPKDTDFYTDDKVRLLRAEFGAKGMYILDYLLCDIYGKNGYFLNWDRSRCFLASDGAGCGCSPDYISEFISGCIRCSFFDERVLKVFGVLTSAGIQRRYIRMFNSRDEITMIKEYWLLNLNDRKDVPAGVLNKIAFKSVSCTENPDKTTGNPDKTTGNPQSKLKDTYVSQNKVKKGAVRADVDVPEEIQSEWNAYVQMRKEIKSPLTDRAKQIALSRLRELAPENGDMQKQILNQSIYYSWKGLFPLKVQKNKNRDMSAYDLDEFQNFLNGQALAEQEQKG